MKILKLLVLLMASALLTACGDDGTDSENSKNPNTPQSIFLNVSVKDANGTYSENPVLLKKNSNFEISFRLRNTSSSNVSLQYSTSLQSINCGSMMGGFSGCYDRFTFLCNVNDDGLMTCNNPNTGVSGSQMLRDEITSLTLVVNDFTDPFSTKRETVVIPFVLPGGGGEETDEVGQVGEQIILGQMVSQEGFFIFSHEWKIVSAPEGSTATISLANLSVGVRWVFSPDVAGRYTLRHTKTNASTDNLTQEDVIFQVN